MVHFLATSASVFGYFLHSRMYFWGGISKEPILTPRSDPSGIKSKTLPKRKPNPVKLRGIYPSKQACFLGFPLDFCYLNFLPHICKFLLRSRIDGGHPKCLLKKIQEVFIYHQFLRRMFDLCSRNFTLDFSTTNVLSAESSMLAHFASKVEI